MRLIRFLNDGTHPDRGTVRTNGNAWQFRHASIQDHLLRHAEHRGLFLVDVEAQQIDQISRRWLQSQREAIDATRQSIAELQRARDLSDVNAQVAEKRADLDMRRTKTNARGEFERELRDLNAELKRAQARLPDQREIADLLSSVAASGRASGLEITLFRQKPEVPHDFYADVPVEMQMRGTYHDVALFLDRVKRLDRIVNVSDIKMTKPRIEGDRMLFRTGRAEVVRLAADRHDQRVIGELPLRRHLVSVLVDERRDRDEALFPVETDHLPDPIPKEMPMRLRQVVGFINPEIHAACGDFMQMRFPEMRSRPFDQRDVCPVALAELVTYARGELEPTGAAADDDDAMRRARPGRAVARRHDR